MPTSNQDHVLCFSFRGHNTSYHMDFCRFEILLLLAAIVGFHAYSQCRCCFHTLFRKLRSHSITRKPRVSTTTSVTFAVLIFLSCNAETKNDHNRPLLQEAEPASPALKSSPPSTLNPNNSSVRTMMMITSSLRFLLL
jgi:hypothetical protein